MTLLSDDIATAATPKHQVTYWWDEAVPGFGLKITPADRKIFILQYRMGGRGTPTRRYTIGQFPDIKSAEARRTAMLLKSSIARRIDPMSAPKESPHSPVPQAEPADKETPRERILAAAEQLFFRNGYATSLDGIALAAGVARQTLYSHFSNKENLFTAVFDRIIVRNVAPMRDIRFNGDLRESLTMFGLNYRKIILSPEGIAFLRLLVLMSSRVQRIAQRLYFDAVTPILQELVNYLDTQLANNKIRQVDTRALAEQFCESAVAHDRFRALLGLPLRDVQSEKDYLGITVDGFARMLGDMT
jgi:TetR/AcrR family transcriptional repressor of mexJK operon